jgi:chromate transporter
VTLLENTELDLPATGEKSRHNGWRVLLEVAAIFLRLGCMSFGGPIAHLGYLRAELVTKRKWLDDAHYADLVALCQFLPGPASSQVVFALGLMRAGLFGALLASLCFTLPSALLMIGFAVGAAQLGSVSEAAWLHGLKLASVAVVAQAVWGMGKKLCPDRARVSLCIGAASLTLLWPYAAGQVCAIALGGAAGYRLYRGQTPTAAEASASAKIGSTRVAATVLGLWALLLAVLPLMAAALPSRELAELDSFYRSGSLVFGGGHVVLPLLRAELVPRGWLSDDMFLAGYAAAQAVPGPLFTFAAYLGAVIAEGGASWSNGFWCLFAIFLPAWLLIGGALPFWQRLRSQAWAQAALAGANAAVVGVLLAAFYQPVWSGSVHAPRDFVLALIGFACLELWRAPAGLVVLGMALAGQLLF